MFKGRQETYVAPGFERTPDVVFNSADAPTATDTVINMEYAGDKTMNAGGHAATPASYATSGVEAQATYPGFAVVTLLRKSNSDSDSPENVELLDEYNGIFADNPAPKESCGGPALGWIRQNSITGYVLCPQGNNGTPKLLRSDREIVLSKTECYIQEGIGDDPALEDDLYQDPNKVAENITMLTEASDFPKLKDIDNWLKSTIKHYPDPLCFGRVRRKIFFEEISGNSREVVEEREIAKWILRVFLALFFIIDDVHGLDRHAWHWALAILVPFAYVFGECLSMWLDVTCMVKAKGRRCCYNMCNVWTCDGITCSGLIAFTFHCVFCRLLGNRYLCCNGCCRCICAPKYIKCRCTKLECISLAITFVSAFVASVLVFLVDECQSGANTNDECVETWNNQLGQVLTFIAIHTVMTYALLKVVVNCFGCELGYFKCRHGKGCFSIR